MKRQTWVVLMAAIVLPLMSVPVTRAQDQVTITDQGASVEFPDRITFSAHIESPAGIDRVVLEYGVEKLNCGTVIAKAFPTIEPGDTADVTWTWEMRKSGSEPPGAKIWYRWRVTDKAGKDTLSEKQGVVWLDKEHGWLSIRGGKLVLHWYVGSQNTYNYACSWEIVSKRNHPVCHREIALKRAKSPRQK